MLELNSEIYQINPYGERINFSLRGKHSVFRNSITTPGATSFNKDEFCQDILSIFAANKVVSLGLVVLEANRIKLDSILAQTTKKLTPVKEIIGFGLDEQRSAIAPFHLRGINAGANLEDLQSFLIKYSFFSVDKPIHSLHFIDSPEKKKGLGGDKYFSEFIIATLLPNKQTYISSFYTSAKHINLLDLVKDFQPFIVGVIVSVTRQLSLNKYASIINKDLAQIVPYGVTGMGETHSSSALKHRTPFVLEWVEQGKVWNGVGKFIEKYVRIRTNSTTIAVKYAKISKNYPIEIKENKAPLTKREFASSMRNKPTVAEEAMRSILSLLNLHFHDRFKEQITIAGYITDFYSAQFRLVIEVDGKSHLTETAKEVDKSKESAFFRHQIMTIRVSNHDAINNPEKVKDYIENGIKKWRQTSFSHDSWDLSEEEIFSQIMDFRESLQKGSLVED